ncbi:MAG: diacylglycerol kinase family protein [Paludibacter sp.]|nr:diacylglycerol kinase family protein [Paludibacter sp.]
MLSLKKEIRSFICAFRGVFYAFKNETHIKIHTFVALIVCILGFLLKITANEWLVCLFCIAMVFSAEMINTAIEKIMDLISPEHNFRVGIIKDIAAGAVLVCVIFAVAIGMIIFIPKILALF